MRTTRRTTRRFALDLTFPSRLYADDPLELYTRERERVSLRPLDLFFLARSLAPPPFVSRIIEFSVVSRRNTLYLLGRAGRERKKNDLGFFFFYTTEEIKGGSATGWLYNACRGGGWVYYPLLAFSVRARGYHANSVCILLLSSREDQTIVVIMHYYSKLHIHTYIYICRWSSNIYTRIQPPRLYNYFKSSRIYIHVVPCQSNQSFASVSPVIK